MARKPAPAHLVVAHSADHHQDQIGKARTSYEEFTAVCDWLFTASRRAGDLDQTIEQLKQMIADRERKASR